MSIYIYNYFSYIFVCNCDKIAYVLFKMSAILLVFYCLLFFLSHSVSHSLSHSYSLNLCSILLSFTLALLTIKFLLYNQAFLSRHMSISYIFVYSLLEFSMYYSIYIYNHFSYISFCNCDKIAYVLLKMSAILLVFYCLLLSLTLTHSLYILFILFFSLHSLYSLSLFLPLFLFFSLFLFLTLSLSVSLSLYTLSLFLVLSLCTLSLSF